MSKKPSQGRKLGGWIATIGTAAAAMLVDVVVCSRVIASEPSIVVFGDDVGMPRLLRLLPRPAVRGAVRAGIRPAQREALNAVCLAADVPLLVQPRADAPDYPVFVRELERLAPDLILVDSYSMLLGPELLAIPRLDAINVHGALLPAYRGANPTQWALLNDERETGVTIHRMTERYDAGDIVAERRVPIRFDDTWVEINSRIRQATEQLLAEQLPRILNGSYDRRPQDPNTAHHYRRRRQEDGRIDWEASVLSTYNLIRALVAPHPGAFYIECGEAVAIDRYLTISEVAALKHARPGVRPPSGTTIRLIAPPQSGNDAVRLAAERVDDGSPSGQATVCDIDWDRRTSRMVVEADADAIDETFAVARRFALTELGLNEVTAP